MKISFIILTTLLIGLNIFAQTESVVTSCNTVDKSIAKFSYTTNLTELDMCREALVTELGVPESEDVGYIKWAAVKLNGIDSPMDIYLMDGLETVGEEFTEHSRVESKKDKTKTLSSLKDNQVRKIVVEFKFSEETKDFDSKKVDKLLSGMFIRVFDVIK